MTGRKTESGRFRVWPGAAAPVGLTLLLAAAAWLFNAKVAADREEAETDALLRESYARLEAGEIAASAKKIVETVVEANAAERRTQEENLRLETRGVLDSAYRLLTASLDRARKNTVSRRDVGAFPPGFDGIRSFLEIVPPGGEDDAVEILRATGPELSALLPAGCSFTVVEDSSRQLFSVGGGARAADLLSEAMTRDFVFNDGGRSRLWSLRVEIASPDRHPAPDAAAIAERLSSRFEGLRLDGVSWQGWLLGAGGKIAAPFGPSPDPGAPAPPPFVDIEGEWMDLDGKRLVWMQKSPPVAEWSPAVAVAMAKPEAPPDAIEAFFADDRWSVAIGVLALLTFAGWGLFLRAALSSRRTRNAANAPPGRVEPASVKKGPPFRQGKKLVRNAASSENAVPEVEGRVIVADIGEDGRVRLDESLLSLLPFAHPTPANQSPPGLKSIPSGSLSRLQAIHRGHDGTFGSRILDQARSQVLKDLAKRVRPVLDLDGPAGGPEAGNSPETAFRARSPTGWKKVE